MPVTKLFFCLVAVAGIAIFLATLPRLTFTEKKRFSFLAVGAFPVVALACYLVAGVIHHEAYEAGPQALPEDTSALFALSFVVGLAASGALLWWAWYESRRRTYEGFLEAQREEVRAIERAKIAAEDRERLMIEGRTQLARIEAQGHLLAIERDRARLQADQDRAELYRQEQALLLAYERYCLNADWPLSKAENELRIGFQNQLRTELGRRSISRLDMQVLRGSTNPKVRQILDAKATIALTP